jgi:hypothetical protein
MAAPASAPCEASSVTTVNGKSAGCQNSIILNEDFNSDNLKHCSLATRFPLDDSTADAEFNVNEKRPEASYMLTIRSAKFDETWQGSGNEGLTSNILRQGLNSRQQSLTDAHRSQPEMKANAEDKEISAISCRQSHHQQRATNFLSCMQQPRFGFEICRR